MWLDTRLSEVPKNWDAAQCRLWKASVGFCIPAEWQADCARISWRDSQAPGAHPRSDSEERWLGGHMKSICYVDEDVHIPRSLERYYKAISQLLSVRHGTIRNRIYWMSLKTLFSLLEFAHKFLDVHVDDAVTLSSSKQFAMTRLISIVVKLSEKSDDYADVHCWHEA